MKPIKKTPVIILLCLLCSVVWADFFPISGYGCEKLYQADSCNINTVLFYSGKRWDTVDTWFNIAEQLDMRIILANATKLPDPDTALAHNIARFSGGQWSVYEAESSYFSHELGFLVDGAWVACTDTAGWLQEGPGTDEQYHYWHTYVPGDFLTYYANFNLRTNDTSETNPIWGINGMWNGVKSSLKSVKFFV